MSDDTTVHETGSETGSEDDVLRIYDEHPMRSGDAALLLEDRTVVEVEWLADLWDDATCVNLAEILRTTGCATVRLLVARPGRRPMAGDEELWARLRAHLDGSVELLPLAAVQGR